MVVTFRLLNLRPERVLILRAAARLPGEDLGKGFNRGGPCGDDAHGQW